MLSTRGVDFDNDNGERLNEEDWYSKNVREYKPHFPPTPSERTGGGTDGENTAQKRRANQKRACLAVGPICAFAC
ncbi:hypothetical protein Lal_00018270 [Lupinus albus]|nr:hypothetical protein Lal_00018270 [Lupinus albus]